MSTISLYFRELYHADTGLENTNPFNFFIELFLIESDPYCNHFTMSGLFLLPASPERTDHLQTSILALYDLL